MFKLSISPCRKTQFSHTACTQVNTEIIMYTYITIKSLLAINPLILLFSSLTKPCSFIDNLNITEKLYKRFGDK